MFLELYVISSVISNIASTDKDADARIAKAWAALNRLNSIWKSTEKPEKEPLPNDHRISTVIWVPHRLLPKLLRRNYMTLSLEALWLKKAFLGKKLLLENYNFSHQFCIIFFFSMILYGKKKQLA